MAELSPLQEAVIRQYKGISFEELNAMYDDENDPMSMDIDEYFDDMDLTYSQKKDRKESADKLKEIFELLIMMVFYYYVDGVYDFSNVIAEAQESYENLVRLMYRTQCHGARFDDNAQLDMRIYAYFTIPKSTSKKKTFL